MTIPPRMKLDSIAFEKMRRIAPNLLAAERTRQAGGPALVRPIPDEVSFKLTNRCDLRCTHCYQWGEQGYHRTLPTGERNGDVPLSTIERVLEATRARRSNVFLWGGEPLVYRRWDDLVALLAREDRWTSICTNGTLLRRRLASLLPLSARLELVLSVDGHALEHDVLRGTGAFAKMLDGLRAVVAAKRAGTFQGEITVNCVIQDAMVGQIHAFVDRIDREGIDTLYLSFPWFISPGTAARMDDHVVAHHPDLPKTSRPSWRSYDFKLDADRIGALRADLARVDATPWRLKIRYNPALFDADLDDFVGGGHRPAQDKRRCNAIRTRMDVFPNGDVVSCKFFPEFVVGNLGRSEVADVWHGASFNRFRDTMDEQGLMPVCAKCPLLYARGS